MDTAARTQRTRSAAMMVLLLVAGLGSSLLGGSVQAGAQERDAPSPPAFAQSEALSFADNSWFGFAGGLVPASPAPPSNTGSLGASADPGVELGTPLLSRCDTSPTLSLPYTVTTNTGVSLIIVRFLDGSVAFDHVMDPSPDEITVRDTEVYSLADYKDAPPGRSSVDITLSVYAENREGRSGTADLDISIDISDCTLDINEPDVPVEGVGTGNRPEITLDSIRLASCDVSPVLSIRYTINDADGIGQGTMFVSDAKNPFIALPDGDGEQEQVTGKVEVPLDPLGDAAFTTWLSIDASDSIGESSWFDSAARIDLDACTVELDDPWE